MGIAFVDIFRPVEVKINTRQRKKNGVPSPYRGAKLNGTSCDFREKNIGPHRNDKLIKYFQPDSRLYLIDLDSLLSPSRAAAVWGSRV